MCVSDNSGAGGATPLPPPNVTTKTSTGGFVAPAPSGDSVGATATTSSAPTAPGTTIGNSAPAAAPMISVPKVTTPAPVSTEPPNPIASADPNMKDPTPVETAGQKLKRLGLLRLGLSRTIATSPQGLDAAASSPLVSVPALYSPGTKGKLGQ